MAHLIDFSNSRANIAYQGETPWHGLGSKIDRDSSIDTWRVEAGLNWEAVKTNVQYNVNGKIITSPNEIIYRNDTLEQLGIVTPKYKPVQPAEILEFFRDLVAEHGWGLDVAGSLDGGKKIWALAKTENEFFVKGTVDKVCMYLMLATSFDGSLATTAKFSSLRVVCNNTLTASMADGMDKVTVGHVGTFNAQTVKEKLGLIDSVSSNFQEQANALASRKMKDKEAMQFIIDVLAGKDQPVEELSSQMSKTINNVFELYKGRGMGSTLKSSDGTAWGVLNSITEHVDHHIGRNTNNRLKNSWFGAGEKVKSEAFAQLLKIA